MNIENHIESTLADFDKIGVLQDVLFIGAWARYFYKNHFSSKTKYHPRLATKDLDILLKENLKKKALVLDLHKKLIEVGYEPEFYQSKMIKYYKNELELEFLVPTHGEKRVVSVKAFNVQAQELPYLGMLWSHPLTAKYGKYKVQVPDPLDYAIHKLIIAQSRAKKESKLQDIRDAEEVLAAFKIEGDLSREINVSLKEIQPNQKSKSKITKSLQEFLDPELRDQLLSYL